jgi:putative nucleotidyltransferase with HDIG domain
MALAITLGSWYYSALYQPRKMQRAYRKALYALAAAVETRDSGTIGHAERVAGYAVAVADELGIGRAERLRIEYAALLRDIGKVNVPASLLNKSTALTPEEWVKVKSHAKFGAEIVASVPFLAFLDDLILHHHECWDGSGYPGGLSGEEIPLGSRILAVTTDYDAITSERPYHEPQSSEIAIDQMKAARGTRYDPAVMDAFLKVLETRENR